MAIFNSRLLFSLLFSGNLLGGQGLDGEGESCDSSPVPPPEKTLTGALNTQSVCPLPLTFSPPRSAIPGFVMFTAAFCYTRIPDMTLCFCLLHVNGWSDFGSSIYGYSTKQAFDWSKNNHMSLGNFF